ncbi:hypothetical protein FB561_1207 [Kribbella amoyensis]|uniref:Uncharacterized protein n=1 Tax=Kribbella amoyensis TaxID=996641 RepID=A0A561BMP1_9ACTN|nr:hypothetical protein [Kribbella amoyensis]TWD80135.1 hypothetical protein FB561_1207 [Kribbella amoyensis]
MPEDQEIGAELHRLAERDPLAPLDPEALLVRGRRGVRRRRVLAVAGAVVVTAVAASVALLPGSAFDQGVPPIATPSPSVPASPRPATSIPARPVDDPAVTDETLLEACTRQLNGGGLTGPDTIVGWQVKARSTQPKVGTAFVAVSPDGKSVATCDVYGASADLVANSRSESHVVGPAPQAIDPNLMGTGAACPRSLCRGWLFVEAGRVPVNAVRIEVDAGNGHRTTVPVNDGWFALLWAGGANSEFPATYRAYDASGKALPQGEPAIGKTRVP